jgi:hypothetical protein
MGAVIRREFSNIAVYRDDAGKTFASARLRNSDPPPNNQMSFPGFARRILSTPGIDRVIGIPNHRLPVCYRSILGDEARADELVPATYRLYPGY